MGNNWKTTRRQGSNVLDPKIGGQSGRHRETTGRHRGVQGRLSGRHTVGEKQWEIRGHSGRQGGGHRQTGTHSGRDSVGDKGDTVGGTERERDIVGDTREDTVGNNVPRFPVYILAARLGDK